MLPLKTDAGVRVASYLFMVDKHPVSYVNMCAAADIA
jgi:hypothetical protein